MDAAFIAKCADPSLAPAIVERFVATAGAEDHLAISVKADGRLILIPKPRAAPSKCAFECFLQSCPRNYCVSEIRDSFISLAALRQTL